MNIQNPCKNQYNELRALWQEAFSDTDEFLDTFFSTAFSERRSMCAVSDSKVVAALYWFECSVDDKKIAYIYAVATLKEYRGQGIGQRLMEKTHQHLKGLGFSGAILVPSEKKLFKFYENIGYKTCSFISEINCKANNAHEDFKINCIDKNEYAKLRRRFLPEHSVLQENENLDFLETSAKFYAGKEFLVALRGEENTLFGIELLGDTSAAQTIVGALGYKQGKFRIIGSERPFAMYYPFEDNHTPPAYFGLAFD